jgi:nucleoside 2-deoxyribosyltransferase
MRIFEKDCDAIRESDLLVAVLDGRSIDEGVCFELGYSFSRGITCVGLQTDPRRMIQGENNPMIEECLTECFSTEDALISWIQDFASPLFSLTGRKAAPEI